MKHIYPGIVNQSMRQAAAIQLEVIRACRDRASSEADRVCNDARFGGKARARAFDRVRYWKNDIVSERDMLAALGGQHARYSVSERDMLAALGG